MDQNEIQPFFYELFNAALPRLAPGDDISTKRALDEVFSLQSGSTFSRDDKALRILDIGCGNGTQTIALAKHLQGDILAVDNYKPFLDELEIRANAEGVSERIRPYLKNMMDLGLDENSYDLIWSEGAIFVIGFGEGLKTFRSLLAPNGLMAITELTWLNANPPKECKQFFEQEYPVMVDTETNIATIRNSGFELLSHFVLPKSSWLDKFYIPLENWLKPFREKYANDSDRIEMIDRTQREIDMYRKYSDYYGYVFFQMQRK